MAHTLTTINITILPVLIIIFLYCFVLYYFIFQDSSDSDDDAGQNTAQVRAKKQRTGKPQPDECPSPISEENSPSPFGSDDDDHILHSTPAPPAGKKKKKDGKAKSKTVAGTKKNRPVNLQAGPLSPIWHQNCPPQADKRPKGSTCHWSACV